MEIQMYGRMYYIAVTMIRRSTCEACVKNRTFTHFRSIMQF